MPLDSSVTARVVLRLVLVLVVDATRTFSQVASTVVQTVAINVIDLFKLGANEIVKLARFVILLLAFAARRVVGFLPCSLSRRPDTGFDMLQHIRIASHNQTILQLDFNDISDASPLVPRQTVRV